MIATPPDLDRRGDRAGFEPESTARWWAPPGVLGCLLVACLLTVLIAWPVLRAPTEWIFGDETVGRFHDPYTVLVGFERPMRLSLYTQPATDFPGALVARGVGGVAAYNVVVLASIPLAALFVYLLAFRVSGSVAGAWFAALFYTFSPFHLAHAAYHPHIAQIQWLPLYLLALWLGLERATPGRLTVLAAALGLVALSNFYFGLIAIVLTPVALVGGGLAARGSGAPTWRGSLSRVLATLAVVLSGGFAYLLSVAPAALSRPQALAFPGSDVERYTARWYAYFVPSVEHPLFGARARAFWDERLPPGHLLEQQLTVGFGLTLLAGIALLRSWQERRRIAEAQTSACAQLRYVPALALFALAALLFSMPPEWRLFGLSFRGLSGWLYELAPMFRAHARFGVVVFLAIALLAAIGFASLLAQRRRSSTLLAWGLAALALGELAPFPPFRGRDVLPTPAHRHLRATHERVKVLDCAPAGSPAERNVPALFGPELVQLAPGADCSESGLAGKLAAYGFTHLIVRRDSRDGNQFSRRPVQDGFRLLAAFDSAWLLAIEAPPAPIFVEVGAGFSQRQPHAERSYRWMSQRGLLHLRNRSGAPREVTLELTLHAMPAPRHVRYLFGAGESVELGVVGTEPTPFRIGPLAVPPSGATLQLESVEPATIADSALHNGDRRALSVALWEWQILP